MLILYQTLLWLLGGVVAAPLPKYLLNTDIARSYEYFVGGRYIADGNFTQIIESTQQMAILFTLRACLSCYSNEPQFGLITDQFEKQNIPVYRCQLQVNPELQKRFKVVRFPYMVLLRKEGHEIEEYRYRGLMLATRTQLFLRNIQEPIVHISHKVTAEEVDEMLRFRPSRPQSLVLYVCYSGQQANRMAGLFASISKSELAGQATYLIISHPESASNLKTSYPEWFDEDPATLLYYRFTSRSEWFIKLDCDYDNYQTTVKVIKEALLSSVQQLTHELFKTASATTKPVFVCVIDSAYRLERSQQQLNILQNVLDAYREQVYLFWVEGSVNPDKKKILGIPMDQAPPVLALLDFTATKPSNIFRGNFETNEIKAYIGKVLRSKDTQSQQNKRLVRLVRQAPSLRLLAPPQEVDREIADKTISHLSKHTDALVICSEGLSDQDVEEIAQTTNRLFRLFYKQVSVVLAIGQNFQLQSTPLSEGTYFWTNQQLVNLSLLSKQCQKVVGKLSQWLQFPAYPCIAEGQLHRYLLNSIS